MAFPLILTLSLLCFSQTCKARNCTPSSCGLLLPNITSPFRLKADPDHCGDPKYELVCENGVASIHLNSHKYYLKAIDYHNFTIRLSHIPASSSSNCSFPTSGANDYDPRQFPHPYSFDIHETQPLYFMSCLHQLHNPPLSALQVTGCDQGEHTYVMVGQMYIADVEYTCTVDAIVASSMNFVDYSNAVTLSDIHSSLLYGFEVSWFGFMCRDCERGSGCSVEPDGVVICYENHSGLYYKWVYVRDLFRSTQGPSAGCFMVLMLIYGVVFGGVSIPLKIIIGFGASYWVYIKESTSRHDVKRVIFVSFIVRFLIGIPCAIGFLIYKFRRRHLSMYEEIESFLQSDNRLTPIRYSYSDIKRMTRGFREKLGEGGFGCVYKGKLRSGHHVAVKQLGKSGASDQDFKNEIATIGRIHHVNVVQLVGYCAERSNRALVFDFMPNGSLEKYIFNKGKTHSMDWDTKFEVAVGVARGIKYLHKGCDVQIFHFDIKPHNILLDDNFVPKISDFGLAKLCAIEKNNVTLTATRGTIGYIAPELINRGIGAISYKADVYSFGMLLMEMVGLNEELSRNNDDSSKYFPDWIYESINQGKEIEIGKTEEINGSDWNESTRSLVRKMTIVALWCIQMNPDDRPSMNKVLDMLEGYVESLQIPEYTLSQSTHIKAVNEEESWGTTTTDSVSLLNYNNATNIEITVA